MQKLWGKNMIISEKQIMQLMRIADGYCSALHMLGEYKEVEIVQNLLAEINDQQEEQLKVVE